MRQVFIFILKIVHVYTYIVTESLNSNYRSSRYAQHWKKSGVFLANQRGYISIIDIVVLQTMIFRTAFEHSYAL